MTDYIEHITATGRGGVFPLVGEIEGMSTRRNHGSSWSLKLKRQLNLSNNDKGKVFRFEGESIQ